jgi:ribosomal-protein-alanine N-acetyltransferase
VKPLTAIPIITTERLRLRPFTMADDSAIFAMCSDPELCRFVRFDAHRTIRETREFLELVQEHYRRGEPFAWAIVLAAEDRVIGSCGFVAHQQNSAEIGYWLGRDYWGNGYAAEAALALVQFGFEQMGLERIVAKCFPDNRAGQRVIEKLGLKYEGVDRSEMIKGAYPELRVYGINVQEWRAHTKNSKPQVELDSLRG